MHPIQALHSTSKYFITASNNKLSVFTSPSSSSSENSSSLYLTSSTPHTSLIRLLTTYTRPSSASEGEEEESYLISTGEDKLLIVSKLPGLEVVSKRELVKRANDLVVHVSEEEVNIVIGDKFGDVYIYPLHPSSPASSSADKALQPTPILGHVSMLNSLVILPSTSSSSSSKGDKMIITGDRDEHIRISRFPNGYDIVGFFWGHKKFISSLLQIHPPSSSPNPSCYLLAAGGDPFISTFLSPQVSPPSAHSRVHRFDELEKLLMGSVVVGPEGHKKLEKGRKKGKGGNGKGKGKGKEEDVNGEREEEEAGTVEVLNETEMIEEVKALEKGLAVVKMRELTGRGVIVLGAGCTRLLFVPYQVLLPPSALSTIDDATTSPTTPSFVDFPHPILDFTILSSSSASDSDSSIIIASLDTSRGVEGGKEEEEPIQIVKLSKDGSLSVSSSSSSSSISSIASDTSSSSPPPTISSLYPLLSLLHHPDPTDPSSLDHLPFLEFAGEQEENGEGGEGKRQKMENRINGGKRKRGREETERRLREQEEGRK